MAEAAAQSAAFSPQIMRARENLKTALRLKLTSASLTPEQVAAIAKVMDDAASAIEESSLMQSHARLNTDKAARYMIQLAKHWGHEFEVTYDDVSALIPLPLGTCSMLADPEGLDVTIEAADLEGLARLEDVVAEHLLRFASCEPVKRLGWTRAWEAGRIDPPALRINARPP